MSPAHRYIAYNDGTGWRTLFGVYGGFYGCGDEFTGIPGGPLFIFSPNSFDCEWEGGPEAGITLTYFETRTLHVVDETLAFAIRESGLLAFYDGESWGPYPPDPIPYDVHLLWADRTSIFVAGNEGIIMSEEDGGWRIHDTGTIDNITALWGMAEDDVWAGSSGGDLLHWNGEVWESLDWPDLSDPEDICDDGKIMGFWSKDGVLFFHTGQQLVRWDGVEFTVLAHWPDHFVPDGTELGGTCEGGLGISSIWGNEVDEVFLAVNSPWVYDAACGTEFLLWWDGSEFHWF
jgi:hypothetical protein